MSGSDKITALDRGLEVLRFIILNEEPQRFTDIKSLFPNLSDSSLTRLLKALIASGYLVRAPNGLYAIGGNLLEWKSTLKNDTSDQQKQIELTVKKIADATGCSASFCQLVDSEHLEFFYTHNLPAAWALYPHGYDLNFEPDHAASLAYLDSIEMSEVKKFIADSKHSKILDRKEYQASLKLYKRDGYYVDESQTRIGLSRLAIPFFHEDIQGVFFIGLSTAELEVREQEIVKIMIDTIQKIK